MHSSDNEKNLCRVIPQNTIFSYLKLSYLKLEGMSMQDILNRYNLSVPKQSQLNLPDLVLCLTSGRLIDNSSNISLLAEHKAQ